MKATGKWLKQRVTVLAVADWLITYEHCQTLIIDLHLHT